MKPVNYVLGSDGYYLFVMCNQTLVASSSFYDHITRHIISFREAKDKIEYRRNIALTKRGIRRRHRASWDKFVTFIA